MRETLKDKIKEITDSELYWILSHLHSQVYKNMDDIKFLKKENTETIKIREIVEEQTEDKKKMKKWFINTVLGVIITTVVGYFLTQIGIGGG